MGRTLRRRAKKISRKFYSCEHNEELISLNSWTAEQGLIRNKKLVLASFDDTGRGVMTKRKIFTGEELLNMPLNITINIISLLLDQTFNLLFLENSLNCFTKYNQKLTFQSLLALYLVFHRLQESNSKWYLYLKSLPKQYTVPYFLPNDVQCYLDNKILSVILKQKEIITSSFTIFKEILHNNLSNNVHLKKLKDNFSMAEYEWAFFTVNTRCVFMDLTKVLDMKSKNYSILGLLSDNTKIALCPYLDMINHSPKARNKTKLLLNKLSDNISVGDLNEDLFSDVRFSIYTENNFEPYTQVFICYGDSYNLKLLTEYGFILPNNILDFISFDYESFDCHLKQKHIKLSQDQVAFINNHGLNKDLYIDIKGLSFNFYALLMVVKYYYKQNSDVSRIIYSSADNLSENSSLNELIYPLVLNKILCIKESISKLESYGKGNSILNNCVDLMCQYVVILEKFIKC